MSHNAMKRWLSLLFLLLVFDAIFANATLDSSPGDILAYPKPSLIPASYARQERQPRSELIATDLTIVCTLDGSIRGIDRYRGHVYWTLQGGPGGSLIKSSAHFPSQMADRDDHASDNDYASLFNDIVEEEEEADDIDELDQEEVWNSLTGHNVYYFVEPQNGGTIYLYREGRNLEELPFSIENIVAHSPFQTDDGTTYIGHKSTLIIAVDPRTGKILQKFDLNQSKDAYIASQHRLPPHTIYLGRHEYKVGIFGDTKWWNLTYSEYIPNKLDRNFLSSMVQSDVYLAADANGGVTAIDVENGDLLWTLDLPFPVISVFDVYRQRDYTITLAKQSPPPSLDKGTIGDVLRAMKRGNGLTTAYVGVHEGSLFALSTERFPLVRISDWASIYKGLPPGDTNRPLIEGGSRSGAFADRTFAGWKPYPHRLCCDNCENHVDCLVGQHLVQPTVTSQSKASGVSDIRTLPFGSNIVTLDDTVPGGFSRYWTTYLLALMIGAYIFRKPLWQAYLGYLVRALSWLAQRHGANVYSPASPKHFVPLKLEKSTDDEQSIEPMSIEEETLESSTVQDSKPTGLDLEKFKQTSSTVLKLSEQTDNILGYGSHGTMVYQGEFDGRAVAVKRLLIDFYNVAIQEVKLLQESDDHPNVVRYFYKEETDKFLYIALELCCGSLHDAVQRTLPAPYMKTFDLMDNTKILYEIMCGVRHLHSLKIVHRDIKPQNILLAPVKHSPKNNETLRVLISDFGLCKKLDGEQSSFHYTNASPAGTSGWRAPELLQGVLAAPMTNSQPSSTSKAETDESKGHQAKATRAIDIFSAGCVFYYVLSHGEHPFGNAFERENNILRDEYDLWRLMYLDQDRVEAEDLIETMIATDPRQRPTADMVMAHPLFWSPSKRLAFLQDASDHFEAEHRDPPSALLRRLEQEAPVVIGPDWYRRIDRVVAQDLLKFRKYDGRRIRDLLRAIRNKKHHWQDLPDAVKRTLGEPPDSYLYYFTKRFPHLLAHTHQVLAEEPELGNQGSWQDYFGE